MRFRFTLDGPAYEESKDGLKRIRTKRGLRWVGDFRAGIFVWKSSSERLEASYERDASDTLVRVSLVWQGRHKSAFLEDLKTFVWDAGGTASEDEGPAPADEKVQGYISRELDFWDRINQPNVEYLKARGRPKAWIDRDLEEWKKRREEKRRELLGRVGS